MTSGRGVAIVAEVAPGSECQPAAVPLSRHRHWNAPIRSATLLVPPATLAGHPRAVVIEELAAARPE